MALIEISLQGLKIFALALRDRNKYLVSVEKQMILHRARALTANLAQAVIHNYSGGGMVFTVNFVNTGTATATIRLAVSTGQSPTIAEYMDYDIVVPAKDVYLRKSLWISRGDYIVVQSSSSAVTVQAWGYGPEPEEVPESIVEQVLVLFSGFTSPALVNGSTTPATLLAVAVSNTGRYAAVGSRQFDGSQLPVAATSTNGTTWTTPAVMGGTSSGALMYGVAVNSSGLFVAVGYNSSGFRPVYSTSSDGSTWTVPALMNGSTDQGTILGVTVNSTGRFVAVGHNNSAVPIFATSTNGTTWTTPAAMAAPSVDGAYMTAVAVNSAGRWVAVGYDNNIAPLFSTSVDAVTWTTPAFMGAGGDAQMTSVTVNSAGRWVAVGYRNIGAIPVYSTSTDGITWTTPAAINGSTSAVRMASVTVNSSGLFMAVGYNNNTLPANFAYSVNGTTWTSPAPMNGITSWSPMYGVAVNSAGLFVAVGENQTGRPLFATGQ